MTDKISLPGIDPPCLGEVKLLQERAAVHTQGVNPECLFVNYRVEEDFAFKQLRRDVIKEHKPTLGEMLKFTSNVIESLHWSSVGIDYGKKSGEKFQKKLEELNFWDTVQDVLIPRSLDSPNDFVCLMPNSSVGKAADGFKIWLVHYENIIRIGPNLENPDYIIFDRHTNYSDSGQYYLGKDGAYKIGDESEYSYEYKLEQSPFVQFGGVRAEKRGFSGSEFYNLSYIQGALESANTVYWRSVDTELLRRIDANLLTIVIGEVCHPCNGRGLMYSEKDGADRQCTSCSGLGKTYPKLGLGSVITYTGSALENLEPDARAKVVDSLITYKSPPLETINLQIAERDKAMDEFKSSLASVFVHQQQSGVAKEIDKLDRTYLVNEIGFNLYGRVILRLLQSAKMLLFADSDVAVHLPDSFAGEKIAAITERLATLKSSGAPAAQLFPEYERLFKKQYGDNPEILAGLMFTLRNDPLCLYSELADKKLAGEPDAFAYSEQLPGILMQIRNEFGSEKFALMTDPAIQKEVEKRFKKPVIPKPISDGSEFNTNEDADI